jgi:phosphoribosyl-ATP pyrophosphohydrolase
MQMNKMFDEFMFTYRIKPLVMHMPNLGASAKLIDDELNELIDELSYEDGTPKPIEEVDKSAAIKEMADIIYITAQRMRAMGVDVDAVMAEVHRSNMSKTVPLKDADKELEIARQRYPNVYKEEGQRYVVLRCADTGKVVKPSCYSPAVISEEMYK